MINIRNIRELGIKQGFLAEGKKGIDNLLNVFKRFMKLLNIPFYDECCLEENQPLPVGYTEASGIMRYNPETKVFEAVSSDLPYLVYAAKITQTGTTAPVVNTVLMNTIGQSITWNYTSVGEYYTSTLLNISANKVGLIFTPSQSVVPYTVQFYPGTSGLDAIIYLKTYADSTAAYIVSTGLNNNLLLDAYLEIRIYP